MIFYNFAGFTALLKKEVDRFMKVYIQTILAPLLSNILFFGVFGSMLRTRDVGIEGVGYLSFLVPGLVAMGAIFAAFQNPSFSLIVQKYTQTIQDLNSYPMTTTEKILAFIFGGTFRGILIGVLTYVSTIYFVGYEIKLPILFILMLTLASFIFASLGVIVGLLFENFEKTNFILSIVLTPLTYFGGVFFEVSKLPGLFSNIRFINPLFPLINLIRYSYIGKIEGNFYIQFIFVIIFAVISFSVAFILFKKGVGLKK